MIKDYPNGAIKTKEELLSKLTPGSDVYVVYRLPGSSWIEEYVASDNIRFETEYSVECIYGIYYKNESPKLQSIMSVLDRNIGQLNGYNCHFIFTDRTLAEEYMKLDIFMKKISQKEKDCYKS